MKRTRIAVLVALACLPSAAVAEVVTLECTGVNAAGTSERLTVRYDETYGWVDDNGVIKVTGGVGPNYLSGLSAIIDRRTGQYRSRDSDPAKRFTGTCEKAERKF